jgi:hypothetical protein
MRRSRVFWIAFVVLGVAGWLSSVGIGDHYYYRMALVLSGLVWAAQAARLPALPKK